ncbi:efflux RND transporter permease subunit [Thermoflavimicrobium dichotomicum]|uniref:Multidrug efflux pump subunit AcrB n=1 Tax=Thermoflavimicrobium dichotomicum TaxID=46223 RepID=A0A1I3TMR9_9BACL|nr:efflux RND transporter permease subunit [Thermoflavimicrobium dichotomicum]SFJ71793.1 Multidrug efflux pump subunit AcrB [Thermoflavimicrobium dichotomicum]
MNGMIRWSLKNSTAVFLLVLVVLFSGVMATQNIKLETFPDVSNPILTVQGTQPGATAEDIEKNLTKPIEDAIKRLNDYENLTSTSGENSVNVTVTYPLGTDLDEKERKLDSALSKLALPEQAEVQVSQMKLENLPVYQAALSSKNGDELQTLLEDKIIPELEQTKGISTVQLKGKKTAEVEIKVNLDKAEKEGLTLQSIKNAIQNEKYSLPAATAEKNGNTIAVRLTGKMPKVEDLKAIIISGSGANMSANPQVGKGGRTQAPASGNTQPKTVRLGDIAEIKTVSKKSEINKVNGNEAFLLEVTKEQNANTTDVSKSVREILKKYQQQEDFDINPIFDQGQKAEDSVAGLIREGLYGALFVVVVIALFLRNVRATIIALVSIPLSILVTLSLLEMMDYTLNIMTLGGMAVAIGRIVDDSIVVIENIYRWKQQKGKQLTHKELVYRATKEVVRAVASSTFVTVVVFLPLTFVEGIIGQFFRPFAISVAISILVSLLVAIMLIPVMGASFFKKVKHHSHESLLTRSYEKWLRGALRKKAWVIVTSILLLFGALSMTPAIGFSFLPSEEASRIEANITLPAATTLTAAEELAKKIDDHLNEMDLFVKRQMTVGGTALRRGFRGGQGANEREIKFTLEIKDGVSVNDTLEKVEKEVSQLAQKEIPTATISVKEEVQGGPGSGNNIDVKLFGDNLKDLEQAARQVEDLLKQHKELKNISNNMQKTRLAWEVSLNDEGKKLGISPNQVMALINERLQPIEVGTYELDGTEQSLVLLYDQKVSSESQLQEIEINTPAGEKKLKEIADIRTANLPSAILHENGKIYAQVSAKIKGDNTFAVTDQIHQDIQSLSLPKGIQVQVGGGEEDIKEGLTSLGTAIAIAIGLVFLILTVTYGGLLTPMVILSSLLFVPVGALTGLWITGQTISMSAMVGLLMLVGIVVTNAIVLLDRVESKRKAGMELTEALIDAAKTRLRPILMTAIATICALIPLALSGASTELISKGLAVTVIGGLTTSTLLTLIFVPVLYAIVGKYRRIESNGLD